MDPGSDVTFSLIAMLGTAYQWKLNGTNLSDNDKYDGSKRSVLTVRNVQESDEGDYQCVVGNRLVSIISERARLTVCKLSIFSIRCLWLYCPVKVHDRDV